MHMYTCTGMHLNLLAFPSPCICVGGSVSGLKMDATGALYHGPWALKVTKKGRQTIQPQNMHEQLTVSNNISQDRLQTHTHKTGQVVG